MSNSGPSTDKVDLRNVNTRGIAVPLDAEPSYGETVGVTPAAPVARSSTVEKKVSKKSDDARDDDLRKKLLVGGAIVAAGVAIVLGVRHFKDNQEPEETTADWAKRKAKETKQAAQDAGSRGYEEGKDALEAAGDKLSAAGEAAAEQAQEAAGAVAEKAQELQQDAKKQIEAGVKEADKRAASPAADLEQRRMTYGQDEHGVPKGLTKDAGFLGFRNWWPGAKKA